MDDTRWMKRCLDLARRGAGKVSPNPLVGAVIVAGNRVIGEGWHEYHGGNHAEVNALASVRQKDRSAIRGATMYVNLEPCHHYGHTPPCSIRVFEEGIRRVVVGTLDPDPRVGGQGAAYLREKGVETTTGVLSDDSAFLNRYFLTYHEKKRPFVILKWAESADGYLGRTGQRTAITGVLAQIENHRWRSEVDAILVGAGTVAIDDPSLTDRWHGGRSPLRIVLDEGGTITQEASLIQDGHPTWILSRAEAPFKMTHGKNWFRVPAGVPFTRYTLDALYRHSMNSVVVEGGRETLQHWIDEDLWDEARILSSGLVLGEGVRAPVIKGLLRDEYHAGDDMVRIISKG